MKNAVRDLFLTPIDSYRKYLVIAVVGLVYIFMPQQPPTDWNLNTIGFWSDILHTYKNPNFVYPPWGLILMLPYQWVHAEGARFFSVIVVGWLAVRRRWSLITFLAIIATPHFMVTLSKSNMDIFVFVLPILIWEAAEGKRWQSIGWGLALSILLLKPQGAILIYLYLFWNSRKKWKELLIPLGIVALITLPISLIGTPPLIIQWLNNILHPSEQNQFFWEFNNMSLTTRFSILGSLLILFVVALVVLLVIRWRRISWTKDQTLASLLVLSMLLSPYSSQQSFSAALAFIPSWWSIPIHIAGFTLAITTDTLYDFRSLWVIFLFFSSLCLFIPKKIGLDDHENSLY